MAILSSLVHTPQNWPRHETRLATATIGHNFGQERTTILIELYKVLYTKYFLVALKARISTSTTFPIITLLLTPHTTINLLDGSRPLEGKAGLRKFPTLLSFPTACHVFRLLLPGNTTLWSPSRKDVK